MSTQINSQNNNGSSGELIQLGVSSCLLGHKVRYDGGHKRNVYILNSLSEYFKFVSICPEMAIGMGVPRPPIRLIGKNNSIHAVGIENPELDVTEQLRTYADEISQQLSHISGYIFKKDSPSCGIERVKVYDNNNVPERRGQGIFSQAIKHNLPNLPTEEEGRLQDPGLRENFIERVFVYYRWQQLLANGLTPAALVEFHSRHKFSLLAHDEVTYREIGPLVAEAGQGHLEDLAQQYITRLMIALEKRATRKRHVNVLMHVMGFLKKFLNSDDKQEMLEIMDAYKAGHVPLIVPITLMKHHLRKHHDPYIEQQYYMNPYPDELMLRNSL